MSVEDARMDELLQWGYAVDRWSEDAAALLVLGEVIAKLLIENFTNNFATILL